MITLDTVAPPLMRGDHVSRWSITSKRYEYFIVNDVSPKRGDQVWTFHHVFGPSGRMWRTEQELKNDRFPIERCDVVQSFFLIQGRKPYDYRNQDLVKVPGERQVRTFMEAVKHCPVIESLTPVTLIHEEKPLPRFRMRMAEANIPLVTISTNKEALS